MLDHHSGGEGYVRRRLRCDAADGQPREQACESHGEDAEEAHRTASTPRRTATCPPATVATSRHLGSAVALHSKQTRASVAPGTSGASVSSTTSRCGKRNC